MKIKTFKNEDVHLSPYLRVRKGTYRRIIDFDWLGLTLEIKFPQAMPLKQRILSTIWNHLVRLEADSAFYRGEYGPYCGLAYSGHNGKYTKTSFHEGDGGGHTTFSVFGYYLHYENIEGDDYFLSKKTWL